MPDPTPTPVNDILSPPADSGSEGTWTKPEKGPDGKWWQYNSKTGEYREAPAPPTAPLIEDLQNLGLLPLTNDPNYYISDPNQSPNATRFVDQYGNIVDPQNEPVSATEYKRLAGQFGGGGAAGDLLDPYAGAANARAEAANARAARAAAINEAMNAIDIQTLRQKAALAGAQFAAPTDTGGYFPQFGPSSPLVRSGLVDPMKFTPVPYNANVGGDQAARDLAMIRSLAGVG